jgi:acyl dehydratase
MVVGRASDLGTHVGNEIGISGCAALEQADVLGFAELPRDRHWIHTDPTRVRTRPASTGSSPMGSSYSR